MTWEQIIDLVPVPLTGEEIDFEWRKAIEGFTGKIIVLDDDPTGVQTVYAVPVYTRMDLDSLAAIFHEESQMVFILTNSRALTVHDTEEMHRLLIRNLASMNMDYGKDYLIISRSDSTLRGHYPLETQVIYEEISKKIVIDGEIIIPAFFEGGRITCRDNHYLKNGSDAGNSCLGVGRGDSFPGSSLYHFPR